MNEREKALRLAQSLDRQLTHPDAPTDGADPEEQALLDLAGRLSTQSPLAPTGGEITQLRRRFEQARAMRPDQPPRAGGFVRIAVVAAILVIAFIGISFLISDVLRIPRPAVGGQNTATPAPARTLPAATATPAPTTAAETPFPAVFPVQTQTSDGVTLELRDLKILGGSFRATFCYPPPDDRDWRLEEARLHTAESDGVFYPASSAQPEPGPDGQVCETFTAAIPEGGMAGSLDITVTRLVALRETTPDCAAVNRQLERDYPGLVLRCDTTGGFSWSVDKTPEGMDPGQVRRLEQTYVDYDVRSGPWAFSVLPVQVAQVQNTGVPDPVVVPAACRDASALPAEPRQAGAFPEIPAGIAGQGSLQSGDFTLTMALACDPSFSRLKMAGDDRSEINGLGVVLAISYTGAPTGDNGVDYAGGIWPFVIFSSSGGSLQRGSWFGQWDGLSFPEDIRPDFTQSDVRLRYVVRLRTPGGQIEGAALAFTLQREPDGYRPVDVTVEPLAEDERGSLDPGPSDPLPFPTLAAPVESLSPENRALLDLMDRWQQPLISAPGWVHVRMRTEMARGNDLYGGLKEYFSDDWYQIDAEGLVIALVHVDSAPDGTPMQQTINVDGKSTNLTYGMTGTFKPYPLDLAYSVKDLLKNGKNIQRMETTRDGRRVIVLAVPGVLTRRETVDAETGAWLSWESGKLQAGDQGDGFFVDTRETVEVAERVDAPPPDVQALLGKEFTGYTPPAPVGTPAPQGFDPSKSKLALRLVAGDKFDAPTFWYGDISADGYLLGRVNLGFSAGSSCARSAHGSKLAFNFMTGDGSGSVVSQSLRWLDLGAVEDVHAVAPEITNLGTLSWWPKEEQLAFFGCEENQTNCGLYRLDPATGQVDRVAPDVHTSWPVLWSPDGGQLAFINTIKEPAMVTVIDFAAGQVTYQGPFNADAWQAPADSPTNEWGSTFPRGMTGNACFDGKS